MNIDNLAINTIRLLSADAIQKANSGHPGLPMGAAPVAYTLFKQMKHNPENPEWHDRDRFVLSAGHGSMLLYSILHLFNYGLSIDDLQNFRQFGSLTPGHPEYKHTAGVEVTTGPLGQGIANAVGMAWAENYLAAKFNKPEMNIVNHYTYALCGDGCLQEGVASEACSLAGTLGLGKLTLFYDSNNITIEGSTDIAFTENVGKRFEAYGWHVQLIEDGNDLDAIKKAIENAHAVTDKPSLIEVKTQIGFGAPNKQGKASAHGEPLGIDELAAAKKNLGFDPNESFHVPAEVREYIAELNAEHGKQEEEWNALLAKYAAEYPEDYKLYQTFYNKNIEADLLNDEEFWATEGDLATRISSEQVLNKVSKRVPNLIGGAADLSPSTKTIMKDRGDYTKATPDGSNLHFGIREHAMSAIANGMALHGGLRPYVAGFFVFSDYMKPVMRLSALMGLPVINIMTHDSIGVGEDGPTHQPIEQLAMLRSIPNFTVMRPCDTHETSAAWYLALTRTNSPSALVLSRQNLKLLDESGKAALRGGYIVKDSEKSTPDIILMASGSEVELIYKAHDELKAKGVDARVVSMMSWEVFEEQDAQYKESVLPKNVTKRLAVEAASGFGWERYTGLDGGILCMEGFGTSAPAKQAFAHFGFTVENVVNKAMEIVNPA